MNLSLTDVCNCKHKRLDYCYIHNTKPNCPCDTYEELLRCDSNCIHYDKKYGSNKCYGIGCRRCNFNPDVITLRLADRYKRKE